MKLARDAFSSLLRPRQQIFNHMPALNCEIFILAGGLSSRMGRDKSRICLGRRTMLGHVRAVATQLQLPVRAAAYAIGLVAKVALSGHAVIASDLMGLPIESAPARPAA